MLIGTPLGFDPLAPIKAAVKAAESPPVTPRADPWNWTVEPQPAPTVTKETIIQRTVEVTDKAAQKKLYYTAGAVGAFVLVTGTIAAIAASRANKR